MNAWREWLVTQAIAVFCIVFGSLVVIWACRHGQAWEAAKATGAGIAGAGLQAFSSTFRQTLLNKDGGTVNVDAPGGDAPGKPQGS